MLGVTVVIDTLNYIKKNTLTEDIGTKDLGSIFVWHYIFTWHQIPAPKNPSGERECTVLKRDQSGEQ